MHKLLTKLDNYFDITKRGSSFRIELLAGLSTFLSLAYIVVVHPSIMAEANFDKSAVFFATIVISATATILMGLWARLPFALAPGLEMDGYVAFFVVAFLGFSIEQALGIVFWSTVIFFLLSLFRMRDKIIQSIPSGMKFALSSTIGVFVVVIGLKLSGIVTFIDNSPSGFGNFTSPKAFALYIGLGVIVALEALKFRGSILVGIIVSSIYCSVIGLTVDVKSVEFSSNMFSLVWAFDPSVILDPRSWAPILVLFVIDFYGSVAKIIGLTINTSMYDEKTKQPYNTGQGLYVDGIAALMSPLMGSSSVTTFVVSGVGIKVGGRTGITAIVCGILLLLTFFIAPLLQYVPVVATSGALVIVGCWLFPEKVIRDNLGLKDWNIAIGMGIIAAIFFSLEKAMLFGYFSYIVHTIFWEKQKPNRYMVGSFLILLIGFSVNFFGVYK